MLRIALFTPTLESIILLSPIYKHMMEEGYSPLFYDVVEEGGWFEKGVQYISLGYSRPKRILRYKDYRELDRLIDRIVEKDEPDIAVLAGYSRATYHLLNRFRLHRIRTLHIESGLRSYRESSEEALRQAIDWSSTYNLAPSKMHYNNLLEEGFPKDHIYISGSTYVDSVLTNLTEAVSKSGIMEELDISRNNYVYSYLSSMDIPDYIDGVGNASLSWDIDIIMPLKTRLKNRLKEAGLYYNLMTQYYIMPIEQVDYLDHLNLIYNARFVLTDDYRVALEAAILKKGVVMLDIDRDLYGLTELSMARYLPPEKLSDAGLSELPTKSSKDISKVFGGGESRIHALNAIKGFSDADYWVPEWRGLYIRSNGRLSILEDYKSSIA